MDWVDLPEPKEYYYAYCGSMYEMYHTVVISDLVAIFPLSSAQAAWIIAEWQKYYTNLQKLKKAITRV